MIIFTIAAAAKPPARKAQSNGNLYTHNTADQHALRELMFQAPG
jgi:hypothetical protein